eukprot:CAMPEP_0179350074 /NCGR_PEP_ID=MMETSP0797-20121207/74567_1 /TAXON_ID=47934 /ORGANISM="Dinophysis acuminata, Strain DAEP01" /LENGTH=245 /DNA_ID=CAMNT_0021064973 /DNA_START=56 /DNA_END=790 /DNA_ORIENTATION=-
MVATAQRIVSLLCAIVAGARAHGGSEEDHGAAHRLLSMSDGTYVCTVCGFVYDPRIAGKAFADEPETFRCPACTQPKRGFRSWASADDSRPLCLNGTHHVVGQGAPAENSAAAPDPCATCENLATYGLRCLPSAQGGMGNFLGGPSNQSETTAAPAAGLRAGLASCSTRWAGLLPRLGSAAALALACSAEGAPRAPAARGSPVAAARGCGPCPGIGMGGQRPGGSWSGGHATAGGGGDHYHSSCG